MGNDLACPPSRHADMKRSPVLMAAEAEYIGTQHDPGYDDLALFNCKTCRSTISVRVAERTAA